LFESAKTQVRDKTFLRGIGDVMQILEGGGAAGYQAERMATSFGSSWMPNLFRSAMRSSDPVLRDYRTRDEWPQGALTLAKRTGQQAVPVAPLAPIARRDIFGRQIEKGAWDGAGSMSNFTWQFLSPIRVQGNARDQLADKLYDAIFDAYQDSMRTGEKIEIPSMPADKFQWRGEQIRLSDEEYDEFLRLRGEFVLERAAKWNLQQTQRLLPRLQKLFAAAQRRAKYQIMKARQ